MFVYSVLRVDQNQGLRIFCKGYDPVWGLDESRDWHNNRHLPFCLWDWGWDSNEGSRLLLDHQCNPCMVACHSVLNRGSFWQVGNNKGFPDFPYAGGERQATGGSWIWRAWSEARHAWSDLGRPQEVR